MRAMLLLTALLLVGSLVVLTPAASADHCPTYPLVPFLACTAMEPLQCIATTQPWYAWPHCL